MRKKKPVRTITVASGKGGVGKTNVVANLGIALRKMGKEVLILDADLGLSNVDILLHLAPRFNIQHVLRGEKRLKDVIVEGPCGIKILPASSGVQELTRLDESQRMRLLEEFDAYDGDIDVLLVDTCAGISENVAFFCIAAQEIVIVTSPEPTALTDAYALIKVLFTRYQEKEFRILVNSARNEAEAMEVYRKLSIAADRFLNVSLDYLGYLPFDKSVHEAVRSQKAFIEMAPMGSASRAVNELASRFIDQSAESPKGTLQFFLGNLFAMAAESK
ncbi:MAG: MinD/ParA family protein [Deltaproteobacteria bacterium]|nr:MinD/ParA family protein [Deltaproteobacteria bacterium]